MYYGYSPACSWNNDNHLYCRRPSRCAPISCKKIGQYRWSPFIIDDWSRDLPQNMLSNVKIYLCWKQLTNKIGRCTESYSDQRWSYESSWEACSCTTTIGAMFPSDPVCSILLECLLVLGYSDSNYYDDFLLYTPANCHTDHNHYKHAKVQVMISILEWLLTWTASLSSLWPSLRSTRDLQLQHLQHCLLLQDRLAQYSYKSRDSIPQLAHFTQEQW
jgi:hypothetical protein